MSSRPQPLHVFIPAFFATALFILAAITSAAAVDCTTGSLPPGDGGDLVVKTGTCTVHKGLYKYHNVNIYGGGQLLFADDGDTDFWPNPSSSKRTAP